MATIVATIRETSGTVTFLRPNFPVAGVSALASFVDDSSGMSGSYTKTFRYSKDGVQYSDWIPLTNPNLAAITFTDYDIFVVELAYDNSTGTGLTVSEVTITGTISEPDNGPIFARSIFARLLTEYDPEVIGWYVSVVNKLYGRGLLAKYIQKVNVNGIATDFIMYWSAIAKFFAYFVVYARRYQNMFNNSDLLGEFLIERGLTVSIHDSLDQRQTLARNFYAEIMKRGTIQIISEVNDLEIYGELLRLVYYVASDEFMFNLYRPEHFGWNLTNSSPLYRGLAWNNESLNKYKNYITPTTAPFVKIDPRIPYELTFFYQADNTITQSSLTFGVNVKDINGNPVMLTSHKTGSTTNNFLVNFFPQRYDQSIFYRLIIYPVGSTIDSMDQTNINNGNNLTFTSDSHQIQFIGSWTESGTTTNIIDTSFVKIFPLVTDYSRGFIQVKNFISCWLLNNNKNYSIQGLKNFITRYLTPYNSYIEITEIDKINPGIPPIPDIIYPTISKTVFPLSGPYNSGNTIEWIITVDNSTSPDTFTGCTIYDTLPANNFQSASVVLTPISGVYDSVSNTATWVSFTISPFSTYIFTISGTITTMAAGNNLINSAYALLIPSVSPIIGDPVTIHVDATLPLLSPIISTTGSQVSAYADHIVPISLHLSNATSGGTWSCSDLTIASITPSGSTCIVQALATTHGGSNSVTITYSKTGFVSSTFIVHCETMATLSVSGTVFSTNIIITVPLAGGSWINPFTSSPIVSIATIGTSATITAMTGPGGFGGFLYYQIGGITQYIIVINIVN